MAQSIVENIKTEVIQKPSYCRKSVILLVIMTP